MNTSGTTGSKAIDYHDYGQGHHGHNDRNRWTEMHPCTETVPRVATNAVRPPNEVVGPVAAVLRRRHQIEFPGWKVIIDAYESPTTPPQGFKKFLTRRLQLEKEATEIFTRSFIAESLREADTMQLEPHQNLRRALESLSAALSSANPLV